MQARLNCFAKFPGMQGNGIFGSIGRWSSPTLGDHGCRLPENVLASTTVPVYVCLSDNNSGLRNGTAIHNYAASNGPTAHVCQGWARSNNGNGLVSTQVPMNVDTCHDDTSLDPCLQPRNWCTELAFKSAHLGSVMLLFGDGSVHCLSQSIDHWTCQYLGARADGEPATIP